MFIPGYWLVKNGGDDVVLRSKSKHLLSWEVLAHVQCHYKYFTTLLHEKSNFLESGPGGL